MANEKGWASAPLAAPLTAREQELLGLLGGKHTNRQIAAELMLAHSTVRWYLRQIYAKLGVQGRGEAVVRARALGLIGDIAAATEARHNLPEPMTPFVGRQVELQALDEWLQDPQVRLVTIAGPGGIGKTRLALALATRQTARRVVGSERLLFPDGVWQVPLAGVGSAAQVVTAVAAALGMELQGTGGPWRTPERQVCDFLREKRLLLLLDNLEHLADAAPFLATLLAHAPPLKVLVTSRRRLQLSGEHLFWIQGLDLPAHAEDETAARSAAVRLFINTARRVNQDFAAGGEALATVVRICLLLEGTPLALELAAAWVSVLPLAAIEDEVRRGLAILTTDLQDLPPRHRSMDAALRASWERLGASERAALARLTLFQGGCTREAAREVAGATFTLLDGLIQQSWLTYDRVRDRYQMHELLRQYAAAKLAENAADEEESQAQHAAYFAALLRARGARLCGEGQQAAVLAIADDIENCRAAWAWAAERARLFLLEEATDGLMRFCEWRSHLTEGVIACRQALTAAQGADGVAARRLSIRMLGWQAIFADHMGGLADARTLLREGEAILARLADAGSDTRSERAFLSWRWGYVDTAGSAARQEGLEQSLALYQALQQPWHAARSQAALGWLAWTGGDYDGAEVDLRASIATFSTLGDERMLSKVRAMLAVLEKHRGRLEEAERLQQLSLTSARRLYDRFMEADLLTSLAMTRREQGRFAEGLPYVRESAALSHEWGQASQLAAAETAEAQLLAHMAGYEEAEALLAHAWPLFGGPDIWSGSNLMTAGMIALAQGNTKRARQLEEQAVSTFQGIKHLRTQGEALAYLAISTVMAGAAAEAAVPLGALLDQVLATGAVLPAWQALAAAALLVADAGDAERGVALYARAEEAPFIARSRFFAGVVKQPIAEAATSLPAAVKAQAGQHGRALPVWATLRTLRAEL